VTHEPTEVSLITRSDFDGLVCAVLLNELELIDEIKFVHPKDMQDGKIEVEPRDITTNLPYVPGAHLGLRPPPVGDPRATGRTNHIIEAERPRRRAWSTTTTAAKARSRASPTR
jgi:hypothetical protein